jgi:ATPase subunit of ABC transporter with duplicated ATPase domains
MGEEKPDGEFVIGDTVKIAYDQAHPNINPDKSIWENFCDGQELIMMGGVKSILAYLSRFNFEEVIKTKVSTLSGGERKRLHP